MSRTFIKLLITALIIICIFCNINKSNNIRRIISTENLSGRDKYGLLASDYDRNGWARINGKWVSNPRKGAVIKYSGGQVISNSSQNATNTKIDNSSSLAEIYPILERVARELEYSDIPALQESFKSYDPLPINHFYELDGKKFYSQQDYFNYKVQKAKAWGGKNDQNNDGKINCQDYAELFYKYASEAGYHVRYISNSRLNHAFNGINIKGTWVAIEPQAAEGGLNKSPLVSARFPAYNPAYDIIKKQN
jgi:hypothetical protein